MVAAMAKKMGIEEAKDPELNELSKDVLPEKVIETMDEHKKQDEA